MTGRAVGAERGCGAAVVGHGAAVLELGASRVALDDAEAAAVSSAVKRAAEESPFLTNDVFASAQFATCAIRAGRRLSPAARAAASRALADVAGAATPQVRSIQTFFTRRSVSTFDRIVFQLTDEVWNGPTSTYA